MQPNYPDIPGYELQGVLGTGGFASVYLARHVLLDRLVALKVMDPSLAKDREFCERFVREARDTARLGDHPNIVTIHDIGRVGDVYYIAMQYLPGPNLKTLLDEGAPCGSPFDIIARVACALAHAHAQGFVHRDIKPANILFDEANEAILSDFGIAKALGRDTQLTAVGSIVGTARYMSPEQATRPDEIDHRSDLYSLGIVLYELLAGTSPYPVNDPMALMLAHVRDPVPELPPELASCQPLIDRLMAKRPENRFESAGDLLEELSRHDYSVPGCPPSTSTSSITASVLPVTEAPVPAPRSRRPLFAGVAALALVLVGGYVTTDPRVLAFISPGEEPTPTDAAAADGLADRAAPVELPLADEGTGPAFVSSTEPARVALPADAGDAAAFTGIDTGSAGERDAAGTSGAIGTTRANGANDESRAIGGRTASGGAIGGDASVGDGASDGATASTGFVTGTRDEARDGAVPVPADGTDDASAPLATVESAGFQTLSDAELQRLQRLLDVAELHELVGRISAPPGANAIEAYTLALSLDPGNAVARDALARLQQP